MKNKLSILLLCVLFFASCFNKSPNENGAAKSSGMCNDTNCTDKSKKMNSNFSCKLTTPELQKRKGSVLQSLRKQILEKKELPNGFAFKFNGSDKMIDELTEFAKTERQCCDFFTFNLSITGSTESVWFEITGEKEAKDFIKTELEL